MHYTFANICSDRFYGNGRTDGMSWKSAGLLFSAGRKKYKAECNGHIRQNNPCGLENVRKEIGGGREREMPVSDVLVERRGDPPAPVDVYKRQVLPLGTAMSWQTGQRLG